MFLELFQTSGSSANTLLLDTAMSMSSVVIVTSFFFILILLSAKITVTVQPPFEG
jgi:hypothetical protein